MSKAHLCYPNSFHSITVRCILENGNFIEDTAYFYVKSNINEEKTIKIQLFKNLCIGSYTLCYCTYGNDKVTLYTDCHCDRCNRNCPYSRIIHGSNDGKLKYFPDKTTPYYEVGTCYCKDACIITESQINNYYRESDFIPREPYRDPNAPYEAAIFGAFFGTAAAFILGPAAIPVIGLSGWTAATGLSATAVLTGVLGGGGAISSYFATLNSSDGKVCVNLPTINIGNCNGRDVNEIGVPIYLKESDYQHFDTNTSKSDLINKINNHPITTLIAQYPRLFKKK